MHSTRIRNNECPACRYKFDTASPVGKDEAISPSEGDIGMCLNCGEAMVYQHDMRVRRAKNSDLADLDFWVLADFKRAQAAIRERGPLHGDEQ